MWRAVVGSTPVKRTNTQGGRWNPPGIEALYTSLAEHVALAELEYLLAAQPLKVSAPRSYHRLKVHLSRVVDLSTPHAIKSLNYDLAEVHSDDMLVSQHIGGAIAWLDYGGLLVPSARAPGTNLVIFANALTPADQVDPV